jgi:parallel beta-helix repeat protein
MKTELVLSILSILIAACCVAPIPARVATTPTELGTTLYVGGSGPGNYSTIQEAVDAAATGDTVYVYDDSSPYHSGISVNKSLRLIGENRETTIIDSYNISECTINISADQVTVQGFTLLGSLGDVCILADHAIIQQCTMNSSSIGVIINPLDDVVEGTIIQDTVFQGNLTVGIYCFYANNTIITRNTFDVHMGIFHAYSFHSNISHNLFSTRQGIYLFFSNDNTIMKNSFNHTATPIDLVSSSRNSFLNNNFMKHSGGASFEKLPVISLVIKHNARKTNQTFFLENFHYFGKNHFDGNYWHRSRHLPYPVYGSIGVFGVPILKINWVYIDRHPAQEPNDI